MRLRISSLGMAAALLTVASAAQAQQTTRPGQITQLPMGQMEQRQTDPTQEINRPDQNTEGHTSAIQSRMRISDAVFCLQIKTQTQQHRKTNPIICIKTNK